MTNKTIKLTRGHSHIKDLPLPVLEEDDKSVKCAIPGGGTILIPKDRKDGMRYFEEVA